MDEIHKYESSATIPNSEIETNKKFKIVTSLSNLITFVGSNCVLDSKNVVKRLFTILKMLTNKTGNMNNNEEVDTMITHTQAKDVNLSASAPTLVELLNKLDDDIIIFQIQP